MWGGGHPCLSPRGTGVICAEAQREPAAKGMQGSRGIYVL